MGKDTKIIDLCQFLPKLWPVLRKSMVVSAILDFFAFPDFLQHGTFSMLNYIYVWAKKQLETFCNNLFEVDPFLLIECLDYMAKLIYI